MASNDSKDLQTQADLQNSINNAIKERAGLLRGVNEQLGQQLQMQRELCAAMECKELDDSTARVGNMNSALKENRQNIDDSTNSTEQLNKELKKTTKTGHKAKGALVGAFVGFKNAISSAGSAFKSLLGGITSLPGSIMRIGGAIMGAWGSMTTGLMDMAQSGGGGGKPIQDSLEKVRASMGDLAGPASQGVIKGWKNMNKAGGELAAGGASLTKIFGRGRAGVAAQLDFMRESAEALGPVFHTMSDQIGEAAGSLVRIRKGLGLSDEALQNMARSAKANGQNFKGALDEVARSTAHLSKKFGLSAKAIGKNLSEIQGDMATFGDYTKAEMAGVAAAMVKVGMEMKDLQGITGKTDDFESAANAVAGLSEAFGMQLDTMELMTADPAKKAEMMRDAFHQAGRSFEDMSRQEKARLADLSGMSQDALQGFLDPSNAGMEFDEFTDAAQDGADGAITQAEANKILTKSIEKLNETMGGMSTKGGFWGLFLDGVKKGIARSPEFRDLMRDIRESMRTVYKAGKKVGKMLMELFSPTGPLYPVMKIFKEYFSPQKWKQRMDGVVAAFRKFVDTMKKDPKEALGALLTSLKEIFLDGGGGKFAQIIKDGLVKGIDVIGSMILGAIPTLLGWIRDGMMALLSMLKGESSFGKGFFDGVAFPMIMEAWGELVAQAGPILQEMGDAIMTLLNMFWDKYGETITNFFSGILTAIFVAAIIKGAAAAAVGAAISFAVTELLGMIKKAGSGLSGDDEGGGGDGSTEQSQTSAIKDIVQALKDIKLEDIGKAMVITAAIAVMIYGGMMLMTVAFKQASDIVKDITIENALKTGAIWAAIVMAVVGVGFAVNMMKDVSVEDMIKQLAAIVLVVAALGLVGVGLGIAISMMPDLELGQVLMWGTTMAVGIAAAGIAMWASAKVAGMGINWKDLAIGLVVMGAVMLALGGIGWVLVKMLKDSATAEQMIAISALMMGLSVMFGVIALALPAAAFLGGMLAAYPFGTAGVALIILGFVAMGMLAVAMAESMLPTIWTLAEIAGNIPNVDAFKAVADALLSIMRAIAEMMAGVANISSALMPDPMSMHGEKFSDSLNSVGDFVDTLINGNIKGIIDTMIALAKDDNITEGGVAAVQAVSSMLGAVAKMMQTFAPSDGAMQSLAEANGQWAGNDAVEIMESVTKNTRVMGFQAKMLMHETKKMLTGPDGLIAHLDGVDFSTVGPLLSAIGPMLSGIAGMMTAFGPSDASMEVAKIAADTAGEDSVETLDAITRMLRMQGPQIRSFIKEAGKSLGGLIKEMEPTMRMLTTSKADPELIAAFGDIVGSLVGSMGDLMTSLGPIIQGVVANASKYSNFTDVMDWMFSHITDFVSTIVGSIACMGEPLGKLVGTLVDVAKGIENPEKAKAGIDVIIGAMNVLGQLGPLFGAEGDLSNLRTVAERDAGVNSPLFQIASAVETTINALFKPSDKHPKGLMTSLIDAMTTGVSIASPSKLKRNSEGLSQLFTALGSMASSMSSLSEMQKVFDEEGTLTQSTGGIKNAVSNLADTFGEGSDTIENINSIISGFSGLTTTVVGSEVLAGANMFMSELVPLAAHLADMPSMADDVALKIEEIQTSFETLVGFINSAGSDPELAAAIAIGEALSGDGYVTVQHENVNINLSVNVTMRADDLAKVLVTDKQYVKEGALFSEI